MPRAGAPAQRRMLTTAVLRTRRLSPSFIRVTVGGPELADFDYQGLDQCIRLFFPRPGQAALRMPTAANNGWVAQFYLTPSSARPHVRNYTVRAFRREPFELDVDFVVHGDGPAASWAARAVAGDPVGIFDEGTMYRRRTDADWQLVVADESAVPAALSIAEQSPHELRTLLYLEVPHDDDVLETELGDAVTVRWLPRGENEGIPGRLALDVVARAELPTGRPSVFVAGESGLATGLRRYLVTERAVAKADVTFYGYWRHGRASIG
ncbi:siderophore-interacting protein [Compostimonas suwonensis]|uniref:NADPH-dependent ferric siderophore reductase n=1 Tax=Compostimonas suwonensis TaxID=1048394 RepID=A0A2M9BWI1_9MICO|nr:siderophore-interacting protein [Compostimonas suwonensis]PJJ62308.1 NADPH-dependent ferric siderophore reductase [Compostimonas suwonensis]